MPENDRGIGSEGLEQGGPSLGNDYSRSIGTRGNSDARDAVIVPRKEKTEQGEEGLNMDNESNRNLTSEYDNETTLGDDLEDDDDDMMEDNELQGMEKDEDDDKDDDENDII